MKLFSACLLSKWGFDDGDLFSDFVFRYGGPDAPDDGSVLVAAVKAYLLPKLKQSVEVVEIETSHNPIRALRVDGGRVDWYLHNPDIKLEPESVEITEQDIFALFPSHPWKSL